MYLCCARHGAPPLAEHCISRNLVRLSLFNVNSYVSRKKERRETWAAPRMRSTMSRKSMFAFAQRPLPPIPSWAPAIEVGNNLFWRCCAPPPPPPQPSATATLERFSPVLGYRLLPSSYFNFLLSRFYGPFHIVAFFPPCSKVLSKEMDQAKSGLI